MSTVGPETCAVKTGVHHGGPWDGHPKHCGYRAAGRWPADPTRWLPACQTHIDEALAAACPVCGWTDGPGGLFPTVGCAPVPCSACGAGIPTGQACKCPCHAPGMVVDHRVGACCA